MLKSGRILFFLNILELRFNYFIVYMYKFNIKNLFLVKYFIFLGFKEILLGFLFKLRILKMKFLEKDNFLLFVFLMVILY